MGQELNVRLLCGRPRPTRWRISALRGSCKRRKAFTQTERQPAPVPALSRPTFSPNASVARSKSARSSRTARTSDGLIDRNRPAKLVRKNTLPSNPLFMSSKKKKTGGWFNWLPDNPLWMSTRKHNRLPEHTAVAQRLAAVGCHVAQQPGP